MQDARKSPDAGAIRTGAESPHPRTGPETSDSIHGGMFVARRRPNREGFTLGWAFWCRFLRLMITRRT